LLAAGRVSDNLRAWMDPVTEITEERTPRGAWTVTTLLFLYMLVNFADKAVVGLAAEWLRCVPAPGCRGVGR